MKSVVIYGILHSIHTLLEGMACLILSFACGIFIYLYLKVKSSSKKHLKFKKAVEEEQENVNVNVSVLDETTMIEE